MGGGWVRWAGILKEEIEGLVSLKGVARINGPRAALATGARGVARSGGGMGGWHALVCVWGEGNASPARHGRRG